ncbi:eIF-2-alpha kinase activator GCN1 [Cymbomonas tetramitiformis]|uniref:EIF-2-alpha kinase activator GCN1 n=1 Tax=Cymbomonas tetramitiformis TaxID=36881 RepID=A0AAE0GCJ9_9CHLO|nr:eIF-2-alpha kinase activator GCN1 [Cymbomonas tetramitiformis]
MRHQQPQFTGDGSEGCAQEPEGLRRAHLRCLFGALANQELALQAMSVVESSVQFIKTGVAKPSQRVEGLLSFAILVRLAAVDTKAESAITKEKFWSAVLGTDSQFLAPSAVAKYAAADCAILSALLEDLLLQQPTQVDKVKGGFTTLGRVASQLLLSPVSEIRIAAKGALGRCLSSPSPDIQHGLVDGFEYWVDAQEEANKVLVEDPEPYASIPPPRFAQALLNLNLVNPRTVPPELAPKLALLSHHECVAGVVKNPAHVWDALFAHICGQQVEYTVTLSAADTCSLFLGEKGLRSGRVAVRRAAMSALRSLACALPETLSPQFMSAAEACFDTTAHDALSDLDIKIFNTHPTQLAVSASEMMDMDDGATMVVKASKGDDLDAMPAPKAAAKAPTKAPAKSSSGKGKVGDKKGDKKVVTGLRPSQAEAAGLKGSKASPPSSPLSHFAKPSFLGMLLPGAVHTPHARNWSHGSVPCDPTRFPRKPFRLQCRAFFGNPQLVNADY